MQAIETMTPQQRQCLALLYAAIVQYGTHEGNDAYRSAHEACQDIPFSDEQTEFDALYNELLKLWRSFTPQPRGQYKIRHMEVGYSSFSYSQWVEDKEQPAPCKEEIIAKADALMASVELSKKGDHNHANHNNRSLQETRHCSYHDQGRNILISHRQIHQSGKSGAI